VINAYAKSAGLWQPQGVRLTLRTSAEIPTA
jgi:hypothetical protein